MKLSEAEQTALDLLRSSGGSILVSPVSYKLPKSFNQENTMSIFVGYGEYETQYHGVCIPEYDGQFVALVHANAQQALAWQQYYEYQRGMIAKTYTFCTDDYIPMEELLPHMPPSFAHSRHEPE
jgi:hypothetical protein